MILPNKYTSKIALYFITTVSLIFTLVYYIEVGSIVIRDLPQIMLKTQPSAPESVVIGVLPVKKVKTTCFTGVECKGAARQNIQVGQVAMAGVPMGTKVKVKETGLTYTVATRPDDKTDLDIFYGYSQEDYQRCLERGVKYYSIEIL